MGEKEYLKILPKRQVNINRKRNHSITHTNIIAISSSSSSKVPQSNVGPWSPVTDVIFSTMSLKSSSTASIYLL